MYLFKHELNSFFQDHHNLISNQTKFEFFNPRNFFPWLVLSFIDFRQPIVLIFRACNSQLNIWTEFSINIDGCVCSLYFTYMCCFIKCNSPLIFNYGILTRRFFMGCYFSIGIINVIIFVCFIIAFKRVLTYVILIIDYW